MLWKNPWETALQEITANGEADHLSTTSIDVLNRLSEKANPVTGICLLDINAFSTEINREGPLLTTDLTDLIRNRVIKKHLCLDHAVITVHERFRQHGGFIK